MLSSKKLTLGLFMVAVFGLNTNIRGDDLPCTVPCGVQCGHKLFVQHNMHKRYDSATQAKHWRACMKHCITACPEQMKTCGLGDAYRAQHPAHKDDLGHQIPHYPDVAAEDHGAAGGPIDDDDDPYASSGSESESEDEDEEYFPHLPAAARRHHRMFGHAF